MPSLNIFRIEFDRPDAVYIPGEIVSGCVIIDLAREKIAEALKLSAKGEANVSWSESTISTTDTNGNSTTTSVTYSGDEIYFSLNISLLERLEDRKVHLPAGLSRYPFCIQIPRDIPCSFEHRDGHIRYTIKAIIVRSWRFNHECKAAFTIITAYDLNIRREQCIGVDDEVNQVFSCLCCFSDGSVNMHVKLPMTGFVPGQWIEAILDLRINTSNIELQKICFKLQQSFEFHATTSKKNDKVTVAAVQKVGPFDKHAVIALRLLIPSVPPSELEFCEIIHLKYILRVVLHSEMYCKIVKEYPILIGTMPLRPTPSTPIASSSSHVSQSTSKNEDVTEESVIVPSAPYPNSSSTDEFLDTPPSYEESCMNRTSCIKDPKESTYVYGANQAFAPKYPVFKFPISHPSEGDRLS